MNRWDIERKGEEKWKRRKGKRQGEGKRKEMQYESKRKGNIIGRGKEREKENLPLLANANTTSVQLQENFFLLFYQL